LIKQAAATLDEASLHCKAALDICEKFAELILFLESNGNLKTIKEMPYDEYLQMLTGMVKRVLAGFKPS